MTDFDNMANKFTARVRLASEWKHVYFGAAYATRIRSAIAELKSAIAEAEAHPEIGAVAVTSPDRPFHGAQCPSYPNCSGGCGLGCTHEIEAARASPVGWGNHLPGKVEP